MRKKNISLLSFLFLFVLALLKTSAVNGETLEEIQRKISELIQQRLAADRASDVLEGERINNELKKLKNLSTVIREAKEAGVDISNKSQLEAFMKQKQWDRWLTEQNRQADIELAEAKRKWEEVAVKLKKIKESQARGLYPTPPPEALIKDPGIQKMIRKIGYYNEDLLRLEKELMEMLIRGDADAEKLTHSAKTIDILKSNIKSMTDYLRRAGVHQLSPKLQMWDVIDKIRQAGVVGTEPVRLTSEEALILNRLSYDDLLETVGRFGSVELPKGAPSRLSRFFKKMPSPTGFFRGGMTILGLTGLGYYLSDVFGMPALSAPRGTSVIMPPQPDNRSFSERLKDTAAKAIGPKLSSREVEKLLLLSERWGLIRPYGLDEDGNLVVYDRRIGEWSIRPKDLLTKEERQMLQALEEGTAQNPYRLGR